MQLTPQSKAKLIAYFPELKDWLNQRESGQSNSVADALAAEILKKIEMVKGEKGDDGYTPVKGKDYFTDTEINQFISHILKNATPIKGKHYFDGEKGDDYVLTAKDKREIADSIQIPIVEKVIEKTEVIKEVLAKGIDVSMVNGAVSKKELEVEKKSILDGMAKADGRIKLIDQRWHGGGLSKVSTDSTLTGQGTPSSPLSVIGGGTWYQDEIVATGQTGTAFSLLHTPANVVFLYLNGQHLVKGAIYDYTIVGKNITLTNALISSDVLSATYS